MITLESIQPEDGINAVTRFIDEATTSVDIAVYQMDPGYSPLIEALTRAKERGVRVRILLSGTIYPPGSTNDNPRDVEILRAQGFIQNSAAPREPHAIPYRALLRQPNGPPNPLIPFK
jgi:phosphatidylserine/phosphatidylglycerophosphate/cardiolipin synthase-like enzyme